MGIIAVFLAACTNSSSLLIYIIFNSVTVLRLELDSAANSKHNYNICNYFWDRLLNRGVRK